MVYPGRGANRSDFPVTYVLVHHLLMAGSTERRTLGILVVGLLLAWAVIGVSVVASDSGGQLTAEGRWLLVAPIFVFLTPPGWLLIAWLLGLFQERTKPPPRIINGCKPTARATATSRPPSVTRSTPTSPSPSPTKTRERGATPTGLNIGGIDSASNANRSRPGASFETLLDQHQRHALAERHHWICQLCLERIPNVGFDYQNPNQRRLSIDHIVPKSHGGSDDLSNLQPVHALCNSRKGGRSISNEEFRELERERASRELKKADAARRELSARPATRKPVIKSDSVSKAQERDGWGAAGYVVDNLQGQLSEAALTPTQRERAEQFLWQEHPRQLRSECQQGHELSLSNTYFREKTDGLIERECRLCKYGLNSGHTRSRSAELASDVLEGLWGQLDDAALSPTQLSRAKAFLSQAGGFDLRSECQRGHELTLDNTYFRISRGRVNRECRECKRQAKG